jgi:hypothetical protein
MQTYQPHVALIEGCNNPAVSEALYASVAKELEVKNIGHTRLSVASTLDLAPAFRLVIEASKSGGFNSPNQWRRPEGYILLGSLLEESTPSLDSVYRELLRSVNDLSCYYGLATGSGIVLANDTQSALKDSNEVAIGVVASCLSLMALKQRLGISPNAVHLP